MNIKFIDVLNFRKLKKCRIELSLKETLFVGANNSGKTSAMDALILFFKAKSRFTSKDFTLSNWKDINSIGEKWINTQKKEELDLSMEPWENYVPSIDVWLDVQPNEIHHVHHLIPTLDWTGGLLGVRLRYEPNNIEELYTEFVDKIKSSQAIVSSRKFQNGDFKMWPKDMWDFLDKRINSFFSVKTYLLNPELSDNVQKLPNNSIPLESEAFNGLIKVDIINAQRGFSGTNPEETESSNIKNLSSQLRSYYDKHLNPFENPTPDDVNAMEAIQEAKKIFDTNLKDSFKSSLGELELLNYPGFGNPKITLSSKFNTVESLNHESSVQYSLDENHPELSLPEKYNGLGYQNLISIIFKLIRFRDEWMQVGKSYKQKSETPDSDFEPLHLVLIEEPEAHLHAQVQQVFINQAYNVLRNNTNLKGNNKFSTQLIISTHSNHIAHEVDFTSLRYFKRNIVNNGEINTSTVINLSKTFGTEDDTTRFAIRYLKTTHCDVFFADAVILVEGPVERMLVPYFIKRHTNLSNCYISILEIGGSHAHRLRPLIESLGVITLIITDIDSVYKKEESGRWNKIQPEKQKGYKTGNDTLKNWLPNEGDLDKLLELPEKNKDHKSLPIKVAYQIPLILDEEESITEVYPYTFEDSLVLENQSVFKAFSGATGLVKKMYKASMEPDIKDAAKKMYEAITAESVKKAEFALELLFLEEPNKLKTPLYIKQGLDWLEEKLLNKSTELSLNQISKP
ncbi:AAA family ATPase [Draconibacterium sp. IB214405]|uniref:AAA family ATPase n=1 Tax=Draconibacterium sp. IB214405 TaxID=3097352 RepID=UPI002A0D3BAC|nr:AAA family ATPase [Draconibacterium sp. IB214405]MDX8341784.1 AAA family ATPase [Draconibacterium sp. IB214405]